MSKSMNKVVSLPRINTHRPEISKKVTSKSRKNSIEDHHMSVIDSVRDKKVQNQEEKNKITGRKQIQPMKRVKSQFLKRPNEQTQEHAKQQKFSLKQNGKLSKIQQIDSSISNVLHTERSSRSISKPQNQNKEKVSAIKKQLNEVTSSILILKKQIKAIEGGTLQIKQQTKAFPTESISESNAKVQQKIQQVKTKTQWSRYDQQILKSMKDRLKQVIINFEKKTGDLKDILEREQKRVKILNQRTSVREQSINKKKQLIKSVQLKQKTANKLIELEVEDYQRKMKESNAQKQLALKGLKSINSDQYHYEVYKKEEARLFEQMRVSSFLQNLLSTKYTKYSEMYAEVEKAEKLMQMHSIHKSEEEFNPLKVYFGSFENKKELEEKIKQNQARLAICLNKNQELTKTWQNIGFNQTQEQQKIINSKKMQIKTGKIREQSQIEKKERQVQAQIRRKREVEKQKSDKMSEIKDWISKLEKAIHLSVVPSSRLDERLQEVIKMTVKQHKNSKNHLKKEI